MGCSWGLHNVTWYLYPYNDIENPEIYSWNIQLKPRRKNNNMVLSDTPSWPHQILYTHDPLFSSIIQYHILSLTNVILSTIIYVAAWVGCYVELCNIILTLFCEMQVTLDDYMKQIQIHGTYTHHLNTCAIWNKVCHKHKSIHAFQRSSRSQQQSVTTKTNNPNSVTVQKSIISITLSENFC